MAIQSDEKKQCNGCKVFIIYLKYILSLAFEIIHMPRVLMRKQSSLHAPLMPTISLEKPMTDCCQLRSLLMICPPNSIKSFLHGFLVLTLSLLC